jgi:hypothetical protein
MLATLVNNTVDAIQTSKKIFVDTFVKHEGLAKSLNEFVDAQTDYTKQAIDASMKVGNEVYKTVSDRTFYTDTMKTMQESVQALYHTQKKKKEK